MLKMKKIDDFCIILTTYADVNEANIIIDKLLNEKLAACIQTINIGSHYSWNNQICHDKEILLLIKTSWEKYDQVKNTIKSCHSYEVPEIIAVNIEEGYKPYLDWIQKMTQ